MQQFFRTIKDIRKFMRRGSPSQDVVKVCPICLGNSLELQLNGFLSFIIPSSYLCRQCNYHGPIYAEIELNEYNKLLSND
ncbi:MAG: hypothetical protein ACXAC8_07320 [Candidatus Hodarchaeales archaeon]